MKISKNKPATAPAEAKQPAKTEKPATHSAPVSKEWKAGTTARPEPSGTGRALELTPPPMKNAAPVGSMSIGSIPHDPDVNMGKWVDKHIDDSQANAPKKAERTAEVKDGGVAKTKLAKCPVLGSLIKEGSLKQDDKGNISLKQLNDVMINRLGITPERAAVTVSTATIGNHASDLPHVLSGKLNIDHLVGSLLDHTNQGDTAILKDGEFHEDKFQALIAHSSDGKTMTVEDFSKAIHDQLKRDGGLATHTKGASEDVFEMAALINTFGTTDDKGVRRIDIDTLRNLYQNQTLPSKEVLMARKATGVAEHVATMAKMTRGIE